MPDIWPRVTDLQPPTGGSWTGSPGAGNFLRGDGSWAEPPAGSGGAHVHPIAEVTSLQAALDSKAASNHTHPASDPWTYARLANDFTTTSATAVDAGLAFTPGANKRYEVYALLMVRTATATVGARPGCAWPTGLTDGVARVAVTSAAGTDVSTRGNITAALLAPVGGHPTTTGSWPADLWALFNCGAAPSGTFRLQLASETAGTTVTLKAGSFIAYREV